MRTALLLLLLLLPFLACRTPQKPAQTNYLDESSEAFDQRMAWWREARFGMFIHWGPYAVPAGVYKGDSIKGIGEWIMNSAKIPIPEYEEFCRAFNPTEYDADAWVKLAKDAGMKYIVITSKHHDGFCLWDSKVSKYDVMDFSPIKRDLLAELKAACDRQGMILGFYHSIMDWHHPDAQGTHFPTYNSDSLANPNFPRYVETYLKPQLRELIENYDPAILWFDGEWIPEWTHEQGLDLYNYVRSLKPDIIINNRVDKGRQGMQGMNADDKEYAGDFGTPEQEILEGTSTLDWESCMTLNDTWGYKSFDHNWKSAETLIHNLTDIAAKGGNYLLNIGPMANGQIPPATVERLQEMGRWMAVNSEAIYGSKLWDKYHEGEDIRLVGTATPDELYIVALRWPGSSLVLRSVEPVAGSEITLLGHGPVTWAFDTIQGLRIDLPAAWADSASRPVQHAYVFNVQGKASQLAAAPVIGKGARRGEASYLFATEASVVIESDQPGAVIHYSLDGSEPGLESPRYTGPLVLRQGAQVRALAFVPGMLPSETATATFRQSRYEDLLLAQLPSARYPGGGALGLVDGQRGSTDYNHPAWQGFEGSDLQATLDLGSPQPITRVRMDMLNHQQVWIFLPTLLRFEVSTDGASFEEVASFETPVSPDDPGPRLHPFSFEFPAVVARYVRVYAQNIGTCPAWHAGAGGRAWLFADELIVS
ncbi:MAG: hypothetical protein OHK0039_45160 [Bacteroidia bacterium]